jgi:hypothetical protein
MNKKKIMAVSVIVVIIAIVAAAFVAYNSINKSSGSDEVEDSEYNTEEIQVGLSDVELTDGLKADLVKLNAGCAKFLEEHKEDAGLVCAYGFLHSLTMDADVTVKKLISEKYFDKNDEISAYTDLLFIRPSDYAEVSGKAAEGDELTIFTGFNTKDGYYVSSDGIEATMLTEEQYNNLVFRYICEHGEITSPEKGDPTYSAVVSPVAQSGADIKYVTHDDKYAIVVTGSLSDPRDVKEYLITNSTGAWSVALEGIEKEKSPKQFVNLQYPDVDFGLFPLYTIADYDLPKTDMSDYVPSLKQLGMMDEGENVTYGCGTGHYVYIVTDTNKKLLGVLDDNKKLNFYQMTDVKEAKNSMMNLQSNAPTYILKYAD